MEIKTAKCERTGRRIPVSDGTYVVNVRSGEWSFICNEAPDKEGDYLISVERFTRSPEAFVDWIAHLNGKPWFDAKKFADFMTRFRDRNDLYGSL